MSVTGTGDPAEVGEPGEPGESGGPGGPGADLGSSPGAVTLHDVATAAGVSRQTVSNVVRRRGRVGASTRARVEALIDTLGYRTHRAASSLRSRRTYQLAHPVAATELESVNVVAMEALRAVVGAAGERGYHLLLAASPSGDDGDHDRAGELDALIRTSSVDGFVLTDLRPADPRPRLLTERRMPFACFGPTAPDLPQAWVDLDNTGVVRDLVGHLAGLGHRDLVFVGYDTGASWDVEREAGFLAGLAAAGIPAGPGAVHRVAGDETTELVADLLRGSAPPTAIVTGSDVLASAAYLAASHCGRMVGRDLAVTGFDGSTIGRLLAPTLTTAAIPFTLVAERVIDRVLRELDGPTGEPGELLPVPIRYGESTLGAPDPA